jgi:hypothetical protein
MPLLTFKRKFEEPILAGPETTTLRRVSCKVLSSELCTATGGDQRKFAYLKILGVRRVRLDQLTNAMALADGLRDAEDLREGLKLFYPGVEEFILIRFRLARDAELDVDWKEALREIRAIRQDFRAVARRIAAAIEQPVQGGPYRTYDRNMPASDHSGLIDLNQFRAQRPEG